VGETRGNSASKILSALEGPNGSTPSGSVRLMGCYPWAAGTKTVPLPTATQFQPLRGWDDDRDGGKASGRGDPALRHPTRQAIRFAGRGVSDLVSHRRTTAWECLTRRAVPNSYRASLICVRHSPGSRLTRRNPEIGSRLPRQQQPARNRAKRRGSLAVEVAPQGTVAEPVPQGWTRRKDSLREFFPEAVAI
jgi:hypothetical protein